MSLEKMEYIDAGARVFLSSRRFEFEPSYIENDSNYILNLLHFTATLEKKGSAPPRLPPFPALLLALSTQQKSAEVNRRLAGAPGMSAGGWDGAAEGRAAGAPQDPEAPNAGKAQAGRPSNPDATALGATSGAGVGGAGGDGSAGISGAGGGGGGGGGGEFPEGGIVEASRLPSTVGCESSSPL